MSLYAANVDYVWPLDKDLVSVFDRQKNKYFRHGDFCRWFLVSNAGQILGRVDAFVNNSISLLELNELLRYVDGNLNFGVGPIIA